MDRPGSDSLFPQLAKPFDLTASLHALEDTGPGMAVWDALNNRDHAAVDLALDVFGDRAVAESMLSLGVHLLRQAGHHHVGLHDRLPGGGYDSIGTHLDEVPIGFCTDDDVTPECACSLATAVHWISGIAPTPRAHLFFAQLALQVNPVTPAPPATLELCNATTIDVACIVQSSAILCAHRLQAGIPDVRNLVRQRLAAVVA